MKKRNLSIEYKTGLLALAVIMLAGPSCSKSFLNQSPGNAVNVNVAIKSEADLNTAVLGLYSSLRATDFYGRTYAIKGDLMSDNSFLSSANSGRYLGFNQYDMDKTNSYPSNIWQNAYAAIKNANIIINSGVADTSDNISHMYAETYAVRALVMILAFFIAAYAFCQIL